MQGPDAYLDIEDDGAIQTEAQFSVLGRSTKRDAPTKKKLSFLRGPLSFCFGGKYQEKRDGNKARNFVEIKESASHINSCIY